MFFSDEITNLKCKKTPLRVQSHIAGWNRKRTSQSASEEGGVTAEAAIILPLVLCALVGIILWGKVFLIHQEMETALLETARQIARQEAVLTNQGQEGTGLLSAGVLFAKNRKEGKEIRGLEISAVNLLQSEYRKDTKEVCLKAGYTVKIPVFLLGTWKLTLKTAVTQKAWNGYAPNDMADGQSVVYVYITEHGKSYHKDSQCYHLHVTIEEVTNPSAYYEGKTSYRPCEFCVSGNEEKSILYICEDGECYHEDLACSGLTRTVQYVSMDQIGRRVPCADCCGGG